MFWIASHSSKENSSVMDYHPLVTIGIPNYNYARYVEVALESVCAQTYPNLEVIIVDDCSTDQSVDKIEEWMAAYKGTRHVKLIKNEKNLGLTKVCNIILQHANGKYFQTLDADDIFMPEKIAGQVMRFQQCEKAALVYSNMKLIDRDGVTINEDYFQYIGYDEAKMPEGLVLKELLTFNFIPHPLIHTHRAREVGGYDETVQVHDYYLWLKLAEKYEVAYMKGKSMLYRIHSSSMSKSSSTNPESVENVLTIKYRYYDFSSQSVKAIIKKDIFNSASYLYQHHHPRAGLWLKRNWILNPSVKSFVLYAANKAGFSFSVFAFFKNLVAKTRE